MCVYKLRHGHLKTACLPTAVLSNSSEMCVCVCEQVESFLTEARGGCRKEEPLSACVTADKSDSQVYHQWEAEDTFSTGQFCNNFTVCLWLWFHFESLSWRCKVEKCEEFSVLFCSYLMGLFHTPPVLHVTVKQGLKLSLYSSAVRWWTGV